MSTKSRVLAVACVAWLVVTVGSGYQYVASRIALPDAVGYEAEWKFQIVMFTIVRLPLFVAALAIMVAILRSRFG